MTIGQVGGEGTPSLKGVALSSGHLFNERLQVPADVPPFSSIDLCLRRFQRGKWPVNLESDRFSRTIIKNLRSRGERETFNLKKFDRR